jgi:hypothetical protein
MPELNVLTIPRATELLDVIDSSEILEYIGDLCTQKHIDLPEIDDSIHDYLKNEEKFLREVYEGHPQNLPEHSLSDFEIRNLRTVDPKSASIDSLETILYFDANNRVLVDYLINERDDLATWANKHPEVGEEALKQHLDTYLLEQFKEQGLDLKESKLYDPIKNKELTYEDYQRYLGPQDRQRFKERVQRSGLAKDVELSCKPFVDVDSKLDQMLR